MLSGIRLEIFERHLKIINSAESGKENFVNELCNFLVFEFDFKEVSIYEYDGKDEFALLGNSSFAELNERIKFSFNELTQLVNRNSFINLTDSLSIPVNGADTPTKTGLAVFEIKNNHIFALRLVRKVNFTFNEIEAVKNIASLISYYLKIWIENRSGDTQRTDKRVLNILANTINQISNEFSSIIGSASILESDKLFPSGSPYFQNIKTESNNIKQKLSDAGKYLLALLNKNVELATFNLNNVLSDLLKAFGNKNFTFNSIHEKTYRIKSDEQRVRYILKTLITNLLNNDPDTVINFDLSESADNLIELSLNITSVNNKDFISLLNKPENIYSVKAGSQSQISLLLIMEYITGLGISLSALNMSNDMRQIKLKFNAEKTAGLEDALGKLDVKKGLNKILIVESDEATTKLLKKYLTKWNYEPVLAHSKKEVIQELKTNKYLAVILDIETESDNSLKLLQKIKKLDEAKNVPVIVCSVEPEKEEAFMMGAVEYFLKPINYNNLVEILTSFNLRRNSNVLCVDDDPPTLNLVKQAIETAGFNSIAVNESDKVMDLIRDKDLDLAIIDLEMPHPNGYELIQEIKAQNKFSALPIIIYTGKEDYQEELKNIEGLFNHLLSKKATKIEELEKVINEMIIGYETPSNINELKESENEIKILLAEDYKHSQIIVTRLLKKNNFNNIIVVENGEEALDFVRREKVDLILMDMQMPVMNGFEAIERIREIPEYREIPIISITAFAMKGDREKCLEAGATDYLPKPIDSKEFIEKIKYYTNTLT